MISRNYRLRALLWTLYQQLPDSITLDGKRYERKELINRVDFPAFEITDYLIPENFAKFMI